MVILKDIILMNSQYRTILLQYLPQETIEQVSSLLGKHAVQLTITRNRVSKLGDYRPPVRIKNHRITINGDLGKYFFYLVFLHEMAHLFVWNKYRNKVSPHGQQWKEEFSSLLRQAVYLNLLPANLTEEVLDFSLNVKATFAAHAGLWKILKSMDEKHAAEITVEDIPDDSFFVASNGRMFKKEARLRKRYRCYCVNNKRRYLFHPMAVIQPVSEQEIN